MSAGLHIAQVKPRPSGWVRNPCLHGDCRRAVATAGLCREHGQRVTEVHNEILRSVGAGITAVSASISGGYVHLLSDAGARRAAHTFVMEAMIGRRLRAGENVHHVNGNRADNRPGNLELWVSSQPSGQRPADLANYARSLLARYGTEAERDRYARERVSV